MPTAKKPKGAATMNGSRPPITKEQFENMLKQVSRKVSPAEVKKK